MTFPVLDLAEHPEADLFRAIARATEIFDQGATARLRGERPAMRWLRKHAAEACALEDEIAATRPRTPEARRAKLEYATRDLDPHRRHFGRGSAFAVMHSALWDALMADE